MSSLRERLSDVISDHAKEAMSKGQCRETAIPLFRLLGEVDELEAKLAVSRHVAFYAGYEAARKVRHSSVDACYQAWIQQPAPPTEVKG